MGEKDAVRKHRTTVSLPLTTYSESAYYWIGHHTMASHAFPIDEAYLIGGWLESCLWGMSLLGRQCVIKYSLNRYVTGFFTLLFAMSMYSIYKKRHENAPRRFTTISIVVL